jgi:hypothetical protein
MTEVICSPKIVSLSGLPRWTSGYRVRLSPREQVIRWFASPFITAVHHRAPRVSICHFLQYKWNCISLNHRVKPFDIFHHIFTKWPRLQAATFTYLWWFIRSTRPYFLHIMTNIIDILLFKSSFGTFKNTSTLSTCYKNHFSTLWFNRWGSLMSQGYNTLCSKICAQNWTRSLAPPLARSHEL